MPKWIKASERLPEAQEAKPLLIDCGDSKRYDVGSLNPFTGNFNATIDAYPPERIEWLDESIEPDHQSHQPKKEERIEVYDVEKLWERRTGVYHFQTSQPIPKEKHPLIKSAIERVVNDDKMFFLSDESGRLPHHKYTQSEVEQLERKAFNAGKKIRVPYLRDDVMPVFPDFEDYKQQSK